MPADVPSFGRNPRGSPDFLGYPVPKACMHVLGTEVPRCLVVARFASSPTAAQALGCSFTPRLETSFGRVTCMARAPSVPRLWTLGFLLLCGACVWVWVSPEPRQSWLGPWVVCLGTGFGFAPAFLAWFCGVCRCAWVWACTPPFLAGFLGCVLLCARSACTPPLLAGVCGVGVCSWARVSAAPCHSWLGGWGTCVFVCAFRLYPTTPGWGLRCGCVCFG